MARILAVCAAVVSIVLVTGCQSSYVNQPSSALNVVTEAKLSPDITVGDKIQATATVHRLLFIFSWGPGKFAEGVNYGNNLPVTPVSSSIFGDTVNEAKAAAAYTACVQNKADFIICPRYYIVTDNYLVYKRTKASVFGYKGVLTGVKETVTQPKTSLQVDLIKPIQIAQPLNVVLPEPKSTPPVATSEPVAAPLDPSAK